MLQKPFFPFQRLEWKKYFSNYVTPREWKRAARDIPFGAGAKSLYVDGVNGHDHNDGDSWKTALKTIQAAVDAAESWSVIFIKAATYVENVTISKKFISLLGEARDTVVIHPSSGDAITISGDNCILNSLFPTAPTSSDWCISATGDREVIENVKLDGANGASGIALNGSDQACVRRVFAANANLAEGICVTGISAYLEISNNILDLSLAGGAAYLFYLDSAANAKIFENDIGSLQWGFYIESAATDISIFHNNFIGNTNQIDNYSASISVFENYFDDHSNVDNGFGIAKAPYAFSGGTDPRPVVIRNGWYGLSWADADLVALASVCTEARLAELDAANMPADIAGLITRTKGLNDIHDDLVTADGVADAILANQKKYWHWHLLHTEDHLAVNGTWPIGTYTSQHLNKLLYNQTPALNHELAFPLFARSTDACTLNIRCRTDDESAIATIYIDGVSQGTIDFYSQFVTYNVIKTISITPSRGGSNVLRIKVTSKNASSGDYYLYLSEMWLS